MYITGVCVLMLPHHAGVVAEWRPLCDLAEARQRPPDLRRENLGFIDFIVFNVPEVLLPQLITFLFFFFYGTAYFVKELQPLL